MDSLELPWIALNFNGLLWIALLSYSVLFSVRTVKFEQLS